jgi:hypothetical protein
MTAKRPSPASIATAMRGVRSGDRQGASMSGGHARATNAASQGERQVGIQTNNEISLADT